MLWNMSLDSLNRSLSWSTLPTITDFRKVGLCRLDYTGKVTGTPNHLRKHWPLKQIETQLDVQVLCNRSCTAKDLTGVAQEGNNVSRKR